MKYVAYSDLKKSTQRRSNAVPPRFLRPKIASVECRAFGGILFAVKMALLTRGWNLFDLYRVLVEHKTFNNANGDQRFQGFA